MRILISNDDGYLAPGIRALHKALSPVSDAVIVAPDRNRSAASSSLTLSHPIAVKHHPDGSYSIEGTPTDCVQLGLGGLLEHEPDMVISGINDGPNMGDDVVYSGTVAAAIEGRCLGLPSIAFSMASHDPAHYDSAAAVAAAIVNQLEKVPLPPDTILNINVPDLPYKEIKGFKSTHLGSRHASNEATKYSSPRGDVLYWIGAAGEIDQGGPGTDFNAVENGYVSVTPITIDMTRHNSLNSIGEWLEGLA
ncbi:MAG: 5'/3'-nucleotidase SurE [Gammaproteobacteria bacterium]|nr:5'/3'-nucleotidase SurE [Gammaproteobacteria bacterium]